MSQIISMSLNKNILKNLDKIQEDLGFSGRSEVIRTALRMLIADNKEKTKLSGMVDGVLLIMHDDKHSEEVSIVRHKYRKLIHTQIHNHLQDHKCLEIFVLKGNAEEIRKLHRELQTNRKIEYSKLIVT